MTSRIASVFLASIVCMAPVISVLGHGDLHEQIATATENIKAHPADGALYHKRGELHRAHGEYLEAMIDYAQAEKLAPHLDVVHLSRGRALFESGKFAAAIEPLNTFLKRQPQQPQAQWLRAEVLVRLGRRVEAETDFKAALDLFDEPTPDQFIERANNLKDDRRESAALEVVRGGIKRLGPLITLELAALDLELALKDYKAALQRLDAILENAPRKETYLVRKAEVLELMGDKALARKCYTEALSAIAALPERQQKLKSTRDLKAEIDRRMKSHTGVPPA